MSTELCIKTKKLKKSYSRIWQKPPKPRKGMLGVCPPFLRKNNESVTFLKKSSLSAEGTILCEIYMGKKVIHFMLIPNCFYKPKILIWKNCGKKVAVQEKSKPFCLLRHLLAGQTFLFWEFSYTKDWKIDGRDYQGYLRLKILHEISKV